MLKKLIVFGQIPYLAQLKPYLYWLAWIAPLSIFLWYPEFGDYAEIGWIAFVSVLAIRPLADIFPGLRILRTLTSLRREVGVFAGMMILAHFVGFLLARGVNFFEIFQNSFYWDYTGNFLWGLIGAFLLALVLTTSNNTAMKILNRRWKTVQHLSYLALILGGIHITLIGENSGIIGIAVVVPLWLLAKFKFKISWFVS